MIEELKACPFCGSEVIDIFDVDSIIDDNGYWRVKCEGCSANMEKPYLLGNYCKGDKDKMRKEVIKEWNRRHEIRRSAPKTKRISRESKSL